MLINVTALRHKKYKASKVHDEMHVNVMCHGVLTAVGGAVLVLCGSRLLFLLSSSLTGSLTRTP